MLFFQDDPSLFEFNECNDYADIDAYEPVPVSHDWEKTPPAGVTTDQSGSNFQEATTNSEDLPRK